MVQIKEYMFIDHEAIGSNGHTKRRWNDGTDDGTARSVIRPMGGRRAGLITAGAVPSSVRSCLQRTKTSTLYTRRQPMLSRLLSRRCPFRCQHDKGNGNLRNAKMQKGILRNDVRNAL